MYAVTEHLLRGGIATLHDAQTQSERKLRRFRPQGAPIQNAARDPSRQIWRKALVAIAIKHSLERANAMPVSGTLVLKYFRAAGYDFLPVMAAHAASVEHLRPRHADPFDRMLVAQALSEPLALLTHDKHMADDDKAIVLV